MINEGDSIIHSSHFFSFVRRSDQNHLHPEITPKMSEAPRIVSLFTANTAAQVEEALSKGKDIEEEGGWIKTTPLIRACQRGLLEVVECLLNHGADPNHFPRFSEPPMQVAAKNGHAAIVERLIRAGVDINDNRGGMGDTALILASQQGHVDVVDCLLSLGSNTETTGWNNATPLIAASEKGMIDVVDRLLAAGCNVNALDGDNSSALLRAAQGGHLPIIDRLVVHGADINVCNRSGWGVLNVACASGSAAVVDRLLSLGCDVNVQDSNKWTPLMIAVHNEFVDVVRLLLDHGADPSICNMDQQRAIDFATSLPGIRILLEGLILLSFHHHHVS